MMVISRLFLLLSCVLTHLLGAVDSWTTTTTTSRSQGPILAQHRQRRVVVVATTLHLSSSSSSDDPSIVSEREYNSNSKSDEGDGENDEEDEDQDDFWGLDELELLEGAGIDFEEEDREEDWIPDAVKAQRKRKPKTLRPANEVIKDEPPPPKAGGEKKTETNLIENRPSAYTDEEEELIEALGGKYASSGRREEGFLGDCTLAEIATDYSVPICYLADVLCMWGVPVPINVHDRLGDLVTGEQAFALVEAVNSLDIGVLQDRYSNMNLLQLCAEFGIDLKDAFEFAMKEGWSLPFGVRTNLRVEQEEELLRLYSSVWRQVG